MGAVVNELVPVVKIHKFDIRLTKRAWLDKCVPNPSMIVKEIMQHITDVSESYLMLRKRIDCDNGNIRIAFSGPAKNHPAHGLAIRNHNTLETPGDKRRRINKLVRHRSWRIRGYCRSRVFLEELWFLFRRLRMRMAERRRRAVRRRRRVGWAKLEDYAGGRKDILLGFGRRR
jgi:hypothetical protein